MKESIIQNDDEIPIGALPSIKQFVGKTFVIKYGGSIMQNEASQAAFIEDVLFMRQIGINIVIVHGGGPEINKWLKRTGVDSRFVKGLRVTDEDTMEIVEMVLSGKVNKEIASRLCRAGVNAVGISGRDCDLIQAEKKYLYHEGHMIDIGFVGDVVSINEGFLADMVDDGQVPVISPIGFDSKGNKYNINADYAACYVSSALNAEKLIILTDIEGVYLDINDKSSLMSSITTDEIKYYISTGVISGGMIPKMECCTTAIENGTSSVHLIDGRKEHSLLFDIISNSGTVILNSEEERVCQRVI